MKLGIGLGALLVLAAGTVYLAVLCAPGAWFYTFSAVVFMVSPLVAASAAGRHAPLHKIRAFLGAGSASLGLAALLFLSAYAIVPVFERTSVPLPADCGDFGAGPHPLASFVYELPGVGPTTLIASDDRTALVAAIDFQHAPYPSTVYLVRQSDGGVLWSAHFANDIISAALNAGTLYLYNDKIGYWIDTRTGAPVHNVFTIDNYGGLSSTDRPVLAGAATGRWYMETSAVISSWHADGSVVSRARVTFNSIAFKCFVAGPTGGVTLL